MLTDRVRTGGYEQAICGNAAFFNGKVCACACVCVQVLIFSLVSVGRAYRLFVFTFLLIFAHALFPPVLCSATQVWLNELCLVEFDFDFWAFGAAMPVWYFTIIPVWRILQHDGDTVKQL